MPEEKVIMKEIMKTFGGVLRLALSLIGLVTIIGGIGLAYGDVKNDTSSNTSEIQRNTSAIINSKCDNEKQMIVLIRIDKRQAVIMQKLGITVPD